MTTDTTVIQPGAGQSILTTDHDHDRHGYHHDGFRETRLDADYRSLVAQAERYGTINGDRINTGVQVTGDRVNAVGAAGAAAACRTNELVQSGFGVVHDRLCDAKSGIVDTVRNGTETASREFCGVNRNIDQARLETLGGFKDAQSLAFQNLGLIQLEAAKNAAALGVQATANANALSIEATRNFNALNVEAVKNAAAAELRAQVIAAAAAAKAAECCCELKELIRAEHVATRGLVTEYRVRDIESERDEARARLNRIPVGVAITIPPGL